MKIFNPLVLAVVVGLFGASTAQAAPADRQFASNPAGICQGALPAFEAAIRKRPLAVQNEGTQTAFVTCAFTSQGDFSASAENPVAVVMWFNTTSGAATSISCTGVSGYQQGPNQFVVKTATAPATGAQAPILWEASDFADAPDIFPSGLFSVSCALPPGTAINDSYVFFQEEIGT